MEKLDLQKREKRAYDQPLDGKNIAIAWRDNKAVIIATNYLSYESISSVICSSKLKRKHIDVTMPKPFNIYIESMDVVNLFD